MRRLLRTYREAYAGLPREVWLLAAATLVNRSGAMVMPFLAIYLTEQRGYEPAQAGRLLALYGVGSILGIWLGGRLTDRLGFLRVQVASLIGTALAFLVLGAVRSGVALGATTLALSIAAEAFRPANSAAVAAFSPPGLRTRAFALYRLALNLGFTIGPAVGGFLARVDYAWLFRADALTCFAAAGVLHVSLRSRTPAPPAEEEHAERGRSPWKDGFVLASLVFLFLQGVVFFQIQSTFPLFLKDQRGLTEDKVGLLIAVNTVVVVLFEMILVRRVERYRPLVVVALGCLLVGVGFGLLPFGTSIAFIVFTILVWTAGEMLCVPVVTGFVANRATAANRGSYMAVYGMTFSVASIAAPIAGMGVYQHLGPDVVWYGAIALGAAACAGFLALARTPAASAAAVDPEPRTD